MDLVEYAPPKLPPGVADRIAAAVEVDKRKRESFARGLACIFQYARYDHAWHIKAARDRDIAENQFENLRKQLRRLAECIDTLAPITRRNFGLHALYQRRRGGGDAIPTTNDALRMELADLHEAGGMEEGEEIIGTYRAVVAEMLAVASIRVWPKPAGWRPSKRPVGPGDPRVPPFDIFAVELMVLIRRCGGRPTLDKNAGTGRLIDALRIARQQLPKGLIPSGMLDPDRNGKLSGMSHLADLRQQAFRRSIGQNPSRNSWVCVHSFRFL